MHTCIHTYIHTGILTYSSPSIFNHRSGEGGKEKAVKPEKESKEKDKEGSRVSFITTLVIVRFLSFFALYCVFQWVDLTQFLTPGIHNEAIEQVSEVQTNQRHPSN